ncbi:hypothetical protein M9458_042374, partial [Cirrhinus mrigala]
NETERQEILSIVRHYSYYGRYGYYGYDGYTVWIGLSKQLFLHILEVMDSMGCCTTR